MVIAGACQTEDTCARSQVTNDPLTFHSRRDRVAFAFGTGSGSCELGDGIGRGVCVDVPPFLPPSDHAVRCVSAHACAGPLALSGAAFV